MKITLAFDVLFSLVIQGYLSDASFLRKSTTATTRQLQQQCTTFDNVDDADRWCRDEDSQGGKHSSAAKAAAHSTLQCYDNFEFDCQCIFPYVFTEDRTGCRNCHQDQSFTWCRDQDVEGKGGAEPRMDDNNRCFDDFANDCYCRDGFEWNFDWTGCLDCNRGRETQWCKDNLGEGAVPMQNLGCYKNPDTDCTCFDGYVRVDGTCVYCNDASWCSASLQGLATAREGFSCYYDLEDHCQCNDGYYFDNNSCEKDCHRSGSDEWCQGIGGEGAYAKRDQDCYDVFENHCRCLAGYTLEGSSCVYTGKNPGSLQIEYGGQDGWPAQNFPLSLCQGDCDGDDECGEGLICSDGVGVRGEEGYGCVWGRDDPFDFNYCIPDPNAPTTPPTEANPPPSSASNRPGSFLVSTGPPQSTDGTTYTMSFVGRFQKLEETGCTFPHPDLVAGCSGSRISLLNTSDPLIVCSNPVVSDNGSSQVVCRSPRSQERKEPFLGTSFALDFGNPEKFGEVYFQCEADSLSSDVQGWFELSATEGGSCNGTSGTGIGAVFQTAQLGVNCPGLGGYIFHDNLFECDMDSSSLENMDGKYSCTTGGQPCFGETCTFSIASVKVTGDTHKFPQTCIVSSDNSPIPEIPPPAVPESYARGVIQAQFQVNVGFYYNEQTCGGKINWLQMSCTNGNITLVENQSVMACSVLSDDSIECNEPSINIARNQYVGIVRYECSSLGQVPQTKVVNSGSTIGCDQSGEQASLELQLGVFCGDETFMYEDYFFECGEGSTMVSKEQHMTCGVFGTVSVGTKNEPGPANPVEIRTDYRWGLVGSDLCMKTQNATQMLVDRTLPPSQPTVATARSPDLDVFP